MQGNTSVGQDLQVQGNGVIGGNLSVAGTGSFGGDITARNFRGDGSGLTNVNASCSACVALQDSPFGSAQIGNANLSGRITAGTFFGDGSGLSNVNAAVLGGQTPSFYQNASNVLAGVLNDARLSGNVGLLNAVNSFTGSSNRFQNLFQNSNQVCDASNNCGYAGGAAFTQGGNSYGALAVLGTNDANSLAIRTNGVERLRVDTSGNVGIGTSTPTAKLNIQGGVVGGQDQLSARFGSSPTLGRNSIIFDNTSSGTTAANQLVFRKNGADRYALGNDLGLNGTQDFFLFDSVANSSRFLINPNGNVGIGTTNPSEKLEVAGNIAVGADSSIKLTGGTFFPANPSEGQVFFRTDTKQLYVYANAKWQADRTTAAKMVATSTSQNKEKADYITDGTNDDVEIQAAIDSLPAAGGKIVLLEGTYNIGQALIIKSNLDLSGQGNNTIIQTATSADINVLYSPVQVFNIHIHDLILDGNKSTNPGTTGGNGIYASVDHAVIEHVRFQNIKKTAMRLCPTAISTSLCYLNRIVDNEVNDADEYGIFWDYPFTDSLIEANNIGATLADIRVQGGTGRILRNHLDGAPINNILFAEGGASYLIQENILEHASQEALLFTMPSYESTTEYHKINISNNLIRGCGIQTTATYDCIKIQGYSAAKQARGFEIANNTFEQKDANIPLYAINLINVDQVNIANNEFSAIASAGEPINRSGLVTNYQSIGNNVTRDDVLSGRLAVGLNSPAAQIHVLSSASNLIAQILQGSSGQTEDLFQARDYNGNILFNVNSSGNLAVGKAGSSTGQIALYNSANTGNVKLQAAATAGAFTATLPAESGTLCIQGSTNCGFALSAGAGAAFVQNGNAFGATGVLGTTDAQALTFRTGVGTNAAQERVRINASGNVGIGTTSPTALLHVFSTFTDTANVGDNGFRSDVTLSPASSSQAVVANTLTSTLTGTANFTNIIAAQGVNAGGFMSGTGVATAVMGVRTSARNTSTGTITSADGINTSLFNTNASGIITNGYGLRVSSIINAGTITNTYGVYIDDVTTGTQTNQAYGLYQADTNARNYFAGNVGIGTTTPGNLLSIGALTTPDATGKIAVSTGGVNNKGIIIQAVAGQNVDLLQAQDSTGAVLASLDKVGNLTVKNATINGTLTVNGHIITANASGTTTIAVGAAACTTPTVSVAGNDTAGTITITTGTGCAAAGILGTVSFASAYGIAPRVVLTPTNANGAGLQYYNGAATTTTFTLDSNTIPTNSTAYTYNYQVLQ